MQCPVAAELRKHMVPLCMACACMGCTCCRSLLLQLGRLVICRLAGVTLSCERGCRRWKRSCCGWSTSRRSLVRKTKHGCCLALPSLSDHSARGSSCSCRFPSQRHPVRCTQCTPQLLLNTIDWGLQLMCVFLSVLLAMQSRQGASSAVRRARHWKGLWLWL